MEALGSVNFSDSPTVNGTPVITAEPGSYGPIVISATGNLSSSTGVVPSNQVVAFYSGITAATSGTTIIPSDNTVPLSTEGTQLWSQTLTPLDIGSKFKFEQSLRFDSATNNRNITFALFRGTTCIYVTGSNLITSGRPLTLSVFHIDQPNTTSSITYSLRVGTSSSSTWYVNQGSAGTITYGGAANVSAWSITEIL